jgi:hypothetical protein
MLLLLRSARRLFIPSILCVSVLLSSCMKSINEETEINNEFVSFTADGVNYLWQGDPYHLYAQEDTTLQIASWYNMIGAYNTSTTASGWIDMVLLRPDNSPAQPPMSFEIESVTINDPAHAPALLGHYAPLYVSQATITEFGRIGEYCSGHFEGTYVKSVTGGPPINVMVKCSWRIKREPI